MALDHFVSQVHLKNFYSPVLGERMYAFRKSDGKTFAPNAPSVCRIENGSSNAYLTNDRVIEDFLKTVEPRYNAVVGRLGRGDIDHDCVYVIAGFAAYVMACSPTGMHLQTGPLKVALEQFAMALDGAGELPAPPEVFGALSLSELLQNGTLKFTVDEKYPQAIGIANIVGLIATLGNFEWEVLRNGYADSPFFTSDFPVALEATADPRVLNRIVPLTPQLAVRIRPDIFVDRAQCDLRFANFGYRLRRIGRQELKEINRLIVQSAGDLVFYRDEHPWVKPFIMRNRGHRIEMRTQEIAKSRGKVLWSRLAIASGKSIAGNARRRVGS